jgi:hypothetical protein
MVLENRYYWRQPPIFIELRSRTGLGGGSHGKRATSFVLLTNWLCLHSLAVHFIFDASPICIKTDIGKCLILDSAIARDQFLTSLFP